MKYFILVIIGIAFLNFQNVQGQVNESDSLAMLDLYESLDGENWTNNTNWLTSKPMNQWYGLYFDGERLSAIDMKNNNCSGMISESLGNCTELKEIFALENNITGIADIDSLHEMKSINLSSNALSEFPKFILKCKNLEKLNLYENKIAGSVPIEFGSLNKLYDVSLSKNLLTGEMPSFKNLDQLTILDISLNKELHGNLQEILFDSLDMTILDVSYSNISGEFLSSYFDKDQSLRLFADSSKIQGINQLQDFSISKMWVRYTDLGFEQLASFQDQNTINQYYYSPQNDVQGPAEVSASSGNDVALTCLIDGADDYQWYKDGQFIQGEKSVELLIQEVTLDDEGQYHCIATQSSLPLLTLKQTPTELKIQTTSIDEQKEESITIFPNPTVDYIQFSNSKIDGLSYSLYNASCVLIDKGIILDNKIDVAKYESGLYTLVVGNKGIKIKSHFRFIKL